VDEYERLRALRDDYEAALDEAERLRDIYHHEIVKLYGSGRSLREIAEGLGISRQRVHQIVSPADTGTPRRRRRAATAAAGTALLLLGATAFLIGRAASEHESPLRIEVVGHTWWWEARYPNGAVTVNEIHIPTGEPVRLQFSTADVIHGFWVPQLAENVDIVPGRTSSILLTVDRPGRYHGGCTEFCGLKHAYMTFNLIAQPPADFQAWVAEEPTSLPTLTHLETDLGLSNGSVTRGEHAFQGGLDPIAGAVGFGVNQ
jgi:heme/copper-type cytochrome/quinol oxidase subunit 2